MTAINPLNPDLIQREARALSIQLGVAIMPTMLKEGQHPLHPINVVLNALCCTFTSSIQSYSHIFPGRSEEEILEKFISMMRINLNLPETKE